MDEARGQRRLRFCRFARAQSGGGVVVAGSTTADLTTTAVADGNTDSFVAKYDADGNQSWITQIQTLNEQSARFGERGCVGQCLCRRTGDRRDRRGTNQCGRQRRLSRQARFEGQDRLRAAARHLRQRHCRGHRAHGFGRSRRGVGAERRGDPVQIHRRRYDCRAGLADGSGPAAERRLDQRPGGFRQPDLRLPARRRIRRSTRAAPRRLPMPASGGSDAFVFQATDNGSSATANYVSYVGTSAIDKAGGLDGRIGRHGLSYRHDQRNFRRADAQRRGREQHVRRGAGERRFDRLDAPIWRRRRPIERPVHRHRPSPAPACSTRSACRAATSTSTSRPI